MAETYTQQDMKMVTDRLEQHMKMVTDRLAIEAQVCGLLERNETLYYTNGSTGVAATLEIRRGVDGDWEYRNANWLPKFTPKDNKRTQYKMIYSAAVALQAASNIITGLKANIEDAQENL